MQVHGPSDSFKDEAKVHVELNPGAGEPFASMSIGSVRLYIDTPEECDWLIRAATRAKALLLGRRGEHPYPDAPCLSVSGENTQCTAGHASHMPPHRDLLGNEWTDAGETDGDRL